jgi:molybdopterin-biosynthesis enzyme MoeA-like protein
MEAMFDSIAGELGGAAPIASWRRTYETNESRIADVLEQAVERFPRVLVGSYPRFHARGSEVEVVLKSQDAAELGAATAYVAAALDGHRVVA